MTRHKTAVINKLNQAANRIRVEPDLASVTTGQPVELPDPRQDQQRRTQVIALTAACLLLVIGGLALTRLPGNDTVATGPPSDEPRSAQSPSANQSPALGRELPPSTEITFDVPYEQDPIAIPDIVGLPVTEAVFKLGEAGFLSVSIELEDNDLPTNIVIGTEPPVNSHVDPASPLTVLVSSGTR